MEHTEGTRVLRVRAEALRTALARSEYRSVEGLVRAANVSRTSWHRLLSAEKQRVDLRVLGHILGLLNLRPEDALELVDDVQGHPISS